MREDQLSAVAQIQEAWIRHTPSNIRSGSDAAKGQESPGRQARPEPDQGANQPTSRQRVSGTLRSSIGHPICAVAQIQNRNQLLELPDA